MFLFSKKLGADKWPVYMSWLDRQRGALSRIQLIASIPAQPTKLYVQSSDRRKKVYVQSDQEIDLHRSGISRPSHTLVWTGDSVVSW